MGRHRATNQSSSSPSVPCARSSTVDRLARAPHVFEARTHVRVRVGVREREDRFSMEVRRSQFGARSVEVRDAIIFVDLHHPPMACGVQSCAHLCAKVAQLDLRPDAAPSRDSSRDRASDQGVDAERIAEAKSVLRAIRKGGARAGVIAFGAQRAMIRTMPPLARSTPPIGAVHSIHRHVDDSNVGFGPCERFLSSASREEPLATMRSHGGKSTLLSST